MIANTFRAPYVPDAEARCCHDCRHLKAAVSWWCTSKAAVKRRGTALPGIRGCPDWGPAKVKGSNINPDA